MPEPLKTWIALDFEAFATQIAFSKRDKSGTSAIKTARFYNVLETNSISRVATPLLDLESIRELASRRPDRALRLSQEEWLSDDPISVGDERYGSEYLLLELMSRLKDECEKLLGKKVCDCVLTTPKRGELYDRLRRAAINAGFGNVMHRDRGICAAHNWALEVEPSAKRVLLCRVGYDATEIYVFKPRRNGFEESSEHVQYEWDKLGLFRILSKAAERVVESVQKKIGSEKADEWRAHLPALLVEMDVKLREFLADPTPVRARTTETLRVGNLKLNLPNSTFATSLAKNNVRIAAGVKDVVESLTKRGRLKMRDFEILVSGDGATEALVDEIGKFGAKVSLAPAGESPAQGCVSFLKELPLPYEAETEEERDYVALYVRAARGDTSAYLPLAKKYLTGTGTAKRYEEGVYWLKEADKYGVAEACDYLAECYRKGRGTAKNPKKEQEMRERAKSLRGGGSFRRGFDSFEWRDVQDPSSGSSSDSDSGSSSDARPSYDEPRYANAQPDSNPYEKIPREAPIRADSDSDAPAYNSRKQKTSRSGSKPPKEASSTTPTKPRNGKKTRFATPARVKEKIIGEWISSFVFFASGARIAANHRDDLIPLGIGLALLVVALVFALTAVVTYYRKRRLQGVGDGVPN